MTISCRRLSLGGLWVALAVGTAGLGAKEASRIVEQPFAQRSAERGATLFRELPAEVTGIATENSYTDPRMWQELNREFDAGALGTGVAIADYDGDGRPDVFVVSKTESCRLFRNLGAWKFEDVTDKAGVRDAGSSAAVWKQGVAFADVNNDGRPDIYVCRFAAENLLYINQGDGTFREMARAYGLAAKDGSSMAAFCDYNRDGWLDVYLQTNLLDFAKSSKGQADYLFRNNRDGTFSDVTDRSGIKGITQGHSATWWDYDNDGWPDLYVANDFSPPDSLYRNNRDGTFSEVAGTVVPHVPFSSMGADLGDVNNDGLVDLFVADMAATTHQKDQRTMAVMRAAGNQAPPEAPPVQHLRNALFLNTGTGFCQEAAFLAGIAATDWTWSARLEDLDNDGRLDLHITNGMYREATNDDLHTRSKTAESKVASMRIFRASPVLREANLAYRNLGDLKFEEVGAAWGLDQVGVSFGAAFGDLDGDGDLDLVYANYEAGVTVLRNDCDNGHRVSIELKGVVSNRAGIGALVRIETDSGMQVRQLVLARGYLSTSEPTIHFGLGADELIRNMTVFWPSGHIQSFADLPADRRFTITEPDGAAPVQDSIPPHSPVQFLALDASAGLSVRSREEEAQEIGERTLPFRRFNRRGPALAVGDVQGEDRDDVVMAGTSQDSVRILLANGAGTYAGTAMSALPAPSPLNDGPVLLFDADGDGTQDVLITGGGATIPADAPEYQPRLLLNDGRGVFREADVRVLPAVPINAGAAAAADFDRDGRLDVFIGGRLLPGEYPLPPRSALLANQGESFIDVTDTLAPALREAGMVTAALWSDVDDDGWVDLLVALDWGTVRYFRNNQGKGFEDRSQEGGFAAAGTGWWNSLAAADFNGDGRIDYVAGNLGLNTQYRASPDRPALLFHGDFGGTGGPLNIEGYYEGDRLFPWRTRKELGARIPVILKRFPRNDPYARATLAEILGEDRLMMARRYAATEFNSGVFLSQPDGTHRFTPLPRIAQISPIQGIAAGDFDGDGHADIYAIQNLHAPISSVGAFDGGLGQLLAGDGRGHFVPVPSARSGLVVTGDAKALVVLDVDRNGWPDFLVSRNDNTTLAFLNQGVLGRQGLRIALRGPRGNPTAVGALILLKFADGTTQASEVYAGSGYYSQSTAACFFGYEVSNPPKQVRVRWPSGNITEHEVSEQAKVLTLSASTP